MDTKYINNLDFAQKKQSLSGEIQLSEMERLQASVTEGNDHRLIRFELLGQADSSGLPGLALQIDAKLPVPCQRCFGPIEYPFALSFNYVVSESEPEGIAESDDVDWLDPDAEMSVLALVEDELLLALPFAPMHEHDCGNGQYESGERVSPFAALKGKFK